MLLQRKPAELAARINRQHYQLDRPVTAAELSAELANLARKRAAGSLDDSQLRLYCALESLDLFAR